MTPVCHLMLLSTAVEFKHVYDDDNNNQPSKNLLQSKNYNAWLLVITQSTQVTICKHKHVVYDKRGIAHLSKHTLSYTIIVTAQTRRQFNVFSANFPYKLKKTFSLSISSVNVSTNTIKIIYQQYMFRYISYLYLRPFSCPFQQKCKKLRTKMRRRHGFSTWRTPTELSTGRQVSHCPSTVLTTASHHHHSPFSLPLLHLASSYSFMFLVLAQTRHKINLTFNAFSYSTFWGSSDPFTNFTFYQYIVIYSNGLN